MNFTDRSQPENQGENLYTAEHLLEEDSLLEKLKAIKDKAQQEGETQLNKSTRRRNTVKQNKGFVS